MTNQTSSNNSSTGSSTSGSSTTGSSTGSSGQLWVMLADAGSARAVSPDSSGNYGTVIEMSATPAQSKGGAKSSFIEEVAHYIGQNNSSFDRLVLVAPDIVLSELREALIADSKVSSDKIIGTMAKDLTNISNQDIRSMLTEYETTT